MNRREFITLLGGAAAAWPLAARAQQPGKVPIIGFLGPGNATTAGAWVVAFAQRLRELGWVEDRSRGRLCQAAGPRHQAGRSRQPALVPRRHTHIETDPPNPRRRL
jgi:hypothetical protein